MWLDSQMSAKDLLSFCEWEFQIDTNELPNCDKANKNVKKSQKFEIKHATELALISNWIMFKFHENFIPKMKENVFLKEKRMTKENLIKRINNWNKSYIKSNQASKKWKMVLKMYKNVNETIFDLLVYKKTLVHHEENFFLINKDALEESFGKIHEDDKYLKDYFEKPQDRI